MIFLNYIFDIIHVHIYKCCGLTGKVLCLQLQGHGFKFKCLFFWFEMCFIEDVYPVIKLKCNCYLLLIYFFNDSNDLVLTSAQILTMQPITTATETPTTATTGRTRSSSSSQFFSSSGCWACDGLKRWTHTPSLIDAEGKFLHLLCLSLTAHTNTHMSAGISVEEQRQYSWMPCVENLLKEQYIKRIIPSSSCRFKPTRLCFCGAQEGFRGQMTWI